MIYLSQGMNVSSYTERMGSKSHRRDEDSEEHKSNTKRRESNYSRRESQDFSPERVKDKHSSHRSSKHKRSDKDISSREHRKSRKDASSDDESIEHRKHKSKQYSDHAYSDDESVERRKNKSKEYHDEEVRDSERYRRSRDEESRDRRDKNFDSRRERSSDSRYWRNDSEPRVRENSDTYWNKYSDKLRTSYNDDSEHHSVSSAHRSSSGSRSRKDHFDRDSAVSERERRNSAEDKENVRSRSKRRVEESDERSSQAKKQRRENEGEPKTSSLNTDMPPQETSSDTVPKRQDKSALEMLTTKTGGAYIPPARLKMMQQQITDKSSPAYQRLAWEALKKSIHGLINKVNTSNIAIIVRELFKENIVRGRGLLCRSIIQAQAASPTFTNVYAALVAIINTKFPNIGELLLRRLIIQFKRGFRRNDKNICLSAATFIAHLVNQQVAHEIVALEILTLLLEKPTDDSVELAIAFLKESGMKLQEVSMRGINAIFETLRHVLHESKVDRRVQYMIEVMFQIRKDHFKDHPAVVEELDLVEEQDQFTHLITLEEATNTEDLLNVFKHDPEYEASEEKYKELRKGILDESSSESGSGSGSESEESESESENEEANAEVIVDNTETNLIALRRLIYLTIQSSLDFEECAHKLMKMELKPGQEIELCHMIIDCCAQQRTYEKFYGLLAQRFCQINKTFIEPFQEIFQSSYDTVHRLETNKLRNVAKFFAHLLYTDAISWEVLAHIKLNEDDTTSSSRIFIKILFQELSEYMGLPKLNERVKDPTLQVAFGGLFPRDNPKNTRFAINFFTSIGLGGLTDELREHLKNQPKPTVVPTLAQALSSDSSDSNSDSSDDEESSGDDSSDSSEPVSKKEKQRSKHSKKEKKSKSKKKKKKKRKKKKSR